MAFGFLPLFLAANSNAFAERNSSIFLRDRVCSLTISSLAQFETDGASGRLTADGSTSLSIFRMNFGMR